MSERRTREGEEGQGREAVLPLQSGRRRAQPQGDGLLSSLQPAELAQRIEGADVVSVAEDETIVREGDAGDALYMIVEGSVTLVCDGPVRRMLAALGEGEFVGEGALLRPTAAQRQRAPSSTPRCCA